MAYVTPNSRAVFYKGTGLTPSYENTLYFETETAKDDYFTSLGGFDTSRISYQRENRNFIRIETNIVNLYNCDYMRFKNDSFENKWFYAFVTAVNYVNNITTEVVYAIDPMMTWMGTFTLGQCYVERQHVRNDSIGANICDEGISTGAFVEEGHDQTEDYGASNCEIRVQYADPEEAQGNKRGGVYDPTLRLTSNSASEIAERISSLVSSDLADNIISVYMVPKQFSGDAVYAQDISITKPYTDVSGYVPKNNKLFCYPYKYLEVDNSEGSTKQFKYEYFNTLPDATSTGNCNFEVSGNCLNSVNLALAPKNYNGFIGENYTNCLTMTDFPLCAWTTDVYQAYLAQKNAFFVHDTAQTAVSAAAKTGVNALTDALTNPWQAAMTGVTGGLNTVGAMAISAGGTAFESYLNNMIDNIEQPEAGSRVHGSPASDTIYYVGKHYTFHKMSITKNYAMMIDNYFTMFGYKIRQVLTPNMNARPHWTYLKTIGCNVGGNLPATDKQAIENILDRGTRFWHNIVEMGDYSLDNSPV